MRFSKFFFLTLLVTFSSSFVSASSLPKISRDTLQRVTQLENEGNFYRALSTAKNGMVASPNSRITGARLFSTDKLEKELLTLGFTQIIFDENFAPRPKLLKILHLSGMPKEITQIFKINEWAQKNLMRSGERWDEQTTRFDAAKDEIMPLFKDLGFIDEVLPSFSSYEGALVHGGLISGARLRLGFLLDQYNKGVRLKSIYFISGARPLEEFEKKQLYDIPQGCPLPISKNWTKPLKDPETESEMAQFVWEQADIPEGLKNCKVYFIEAPMKYDEKLDKMIRPNTDDTIYAWLKSEPLEGSYLAVTNAPYILRQDAVVRSLCPQGYTFDTIGPGANNIKRVAIVLDELAKLIFQSKKAAEKKMGT